MVGSVVNAGVAFGFLTVQVTFQATASTSWLDVGSAGFPGFDVGQYSVEVEKASLVDAIEADWPLPLTPTNIKVYFAGVDEVTNREGESFVTTPWTSGEMSAALRAFQGYSAVANVAFTVVNDPAAADLVMVNREEELPDLTGRARMPHRSKSAG